MGNINRRWHPQGMAPNRLGRRKTTENAQNACSRERIAFWK
jgi:hypothetical protein